MALVDIHTGKQNTVHYEWVVVGDNAPGCKLGDIRHIQWTRHHTSPLLEVDYVDTKERTRVQRLQVSAEFQKRGWVLLRDLYAQDPERAKHWADWTAFCDAQRSNKLGMKGREVPEKYLPRKLLEMRAEGGKSAAERNTFRFPSDELEEMREELGVPEPSPAPKKKPSAAQRKASA